MYNALIQTVFYLKKLESILQQYSWKLNKARKCFSTDSQIAFSEVECSPWSGKDLCNVTGNKLVDEKINLIFLNSMFMTPSPI